MCPTFERKLQQRQKNEGGHQLVKEESGLVHQVAFLSDGNEHVEKLLGHEVALIVRVECVHAVLNNVIP